MNPFKTIIQFLFATVLVIFQQGLGFVFGLLAYDYAGLFWGIVVWLLFIPMLYLNYWTYRYVFKHGIILFMTANADTSEIDIHPEDNPYRKRD